MNNFYNLVRKETKELLTKQMILSLVFMIVIFVMMGQFIGGIREEKSKPIDTAVLDLDKTTVSGNFIDNMAQQGNIQINMIDESSIEKALKKIKEREKRALLVVPAGFGKNLEEKKTAELEVYSIVKGLSITEMSGSFLLRIINRMDRQVALDFIQQIAPDESAQDLMHPIRAREFVVVGDKAVPGNPGMIEAFAVSQSVMIPVILMITIMYSGIMVITSMGMEKENKTLETLLTLPVKRASIVAGKMLGAAIVALIMAGIYMIGFSYYMSSVIPTTSGAAMTAMISELGLTMSPVSYFLLGISLFLAILTALSLSMILGLFVQDAKSAQGMVMPIVLLVMFPFLVSMFRDIGSLPLALRVILFLIPFSHPTIAAKALIFHNYLPVIGGMIYMAAFAAGSIYLAVRILNTDKMLTAHLSLRRRKKIK